MNYILLTRSHGSKYNTISFTDNDILWSVEHYNDGVRKSPYTVGQFRNMPKYTGFRYVMIWEWV